jgi:class 3 adenylate cyclase
MTLADDITGKAKHTFKDQWSTREGSVVPDPEDVGLGNDAVSFDRATVLYADLDESTSLVDRKKWWFAGEVYKTYLYAASRLINDAGGDIVSYDGDRVMGIFVGRNQCNEAANCALKINYAVKHLVQPELDARYPDADYKIRHVVGIDTSIIRAARTGVRGDNDLVWIGKAANYAAKLTTMSADYASWMTKRVYDYLDDAQKYGGDNQEAMWEKRLWTSMDNLEIYRSSWWRKVK